jgi:hypothetical protein
MLMLAFALAASIIVVHTTPKPHGAITLSPRDSRRAETQ